MTHLSSGETASEIGRLLTRRGSPGAGTKSCLLVGRFMTSGALCCARRGELVGITNRRPEITDTCGSAATGVVRLILGITKVLHKPEKAACMVDEEVLFEGLLH